ncbi:MAG: excinuclease ABC subunit UvrA [Polyangiaceae bacterium]|nr:excinuclease ABC subunit UvrA [Polyangiaceae bacterium]MCW5791162.1 excinuclease ABC subunit UvrA [Polyangiaceae bacterium]
MTGRAEGAKGRGKAKETKGRGEAKGRSGGAVRGASTISSGKKSALAELELDHVAIRGAAEHNLKSVNVEIPKRQLVVLTGVSGSGKSSLAFDTLYAEGQRRYVESLSAYARQFLGRLDKPKFDTIRGLSPTISIEQKTAGNNPRSTVGTITEIADYLRVLYARVGHQHCHECGARVSGQTAQQIAHDLAALPEGTRITLLAPLIVNRKGEHRELLERARAEGYARLRVDGELVQTEALVALDKRKKHHVEAVIDRVVVRASERARLLDSVERALARGEGSLIAQLTMDAGTTDRVFSQHRACQACKISFPELTPQSFSFNGPQGMCPDCSGLGTRVAIDPALVIPDPSLSLDEGAVVPWGPDVSTKSGWSHDFRSQIIQGLGIDPKRPIKRLTQRQLDQLLYGTGNRTYQVKWRGKTGEGQFETEWEGLIPRLMRRFAATQSERSKAWYARFMGNTPCTSCRGGRLRAESAAVKVGGVGLVTLSAMTVERAHAVLSELSLSGAERTIASEVLKEVQSRLSFLLAVGLGYLSLDRAGPTLSGGESQRIRLASQVGSELTGVIYILDEPSIGLHQRDNQRLLATLMRLRDIGNSVVVVEHDEDTIRGADHVIDFGPGAGVNGGRVVYAGSASGLLRARDSLTGEYLSGKRRVSEPRTPREPAGFLEVEGARENNLKDLTVRFPLGVLTAVTGVSGAGKSTLVNDVLYPAAARELNGASQRVGAHSAVRGLAQLDKVIDIDQRPIGRTPRSNPATYIKVFDEIRQLFAELPEARMQGYQPGRFSFNVKGGRCEACEGDGVRRVEMHFLADVYVRCEECEGRRFNEATLAVRYRGLSIADVLALTVREALDLFSAHPKVREPLALLAEVGVDYLHLGQPSPTLSGGEAQRIKLARELSRRDTGKTLYILDEPTTGLHFEDVRRLLEVLQRLVDAGNTVVVIEHHLDVIRAADWIIDLGPEGGPGGGELIAEGPPAVIERAQGSETGRFLGALS